MCTNATFKTDEHRQVVILSYCCTTHDNKVVLSDEHKNYLWADKEQMINLLSKPIVDDLNCNSVWDYIFLNKDGLVIRFEVLEKSEFEKQSRGIFAILAHNMTAIAPTGNSYEDDYIGWNTAVSVRLFCTFQAKTEKTPKRKTASKCTSRKGSDYLLSVFLCFMIMVVSI